MPNGGRVRYFFNEILVSRCHTLFPRKRIYLEIKYDLTAFWKRIPAHSFVPIMKDTWANKTQSCLRFTRKYWLQFCIRFFPSTSSNTPPLHRGRHLFPIFFAVIGRPPGNRINTTSGKPLPTVNHIHLFFSTAPISVIHSCWPSHDAIIFFFSTPFLTVNLLRLSPTKSHRKTSVFPLTEFLVQYKMCR